MIRDVTDLEVYSDSLEYFKELCAFVRKVPRSDFDSVIQSKKCGKSIPANIAEGFAKRGYEAEFKRFLMIALGSSDELITHLRTVAISAPWLANESRGLIEKYKSISRRLNKLHSIWRNQKP